jgi:formamidopyrimidine-DNA glycosylase
MDQRRIAGIGNLLADEILWRSRASWWCSTEQLLVPGYCPEIANSWHTCW